MGGVILAALAYFWLLPNLYANNARFQIQRGNRDRALGRIDQARRLGLSVATCDALRLEAQFAAGQFEEALELASHLDAASEPIDDSRVWLCAGYAALFAGDSNQAAKWLTRSATSGSGAREVGALGEAGAALAEGHARTAVRRLEGIETEDKRTEFLIEWTRGRAMRQALRPAEAIEPLQRAAALWPEAKAAQSELARAYRDAGDFESYRFWLDRVRAVNGPAEGLVREDSAARRWVAQAMDDREAGAPPAGVGAYLAEGGVSPSAVEAARLSKRLADAEEREFLLELGASLEAEKRLPAAVETYKVAAAAWPGSKAAAFHLRRAERKLDSMEQAVMLDAIVDFNPLDNPQQWWMPGEMTLAPETARDPKQLEPGESASRSLAVVPGLWTMEAAVAADTDGPSGGVWAQIEFGPSRRTVYLNSRIPRIVRLQAAIPDGATRMTLKIVNPDSVSLLKKAPRASGKLSVLGAGWMDAPLR